MREMIGRVVRLLVLTAGSLVSIASLGPGRFEPPEPDDCSDGIASGASAVELGDANDDAFTLLDPGDIVHLEFGGQGTAMLGLRFRIGGDAPPECAAQQTQLAMCRDGQACQDTAQIANNITALKTYAVGAGVRATKTLWIVLDGPELAPGQWVLVTTTVAGAALEQRLAIDEVPVDAGPLPDAAEPLPACRCPDGVDICRTDCPGDTWCITDVCAELCTDGDCPPGRECTETAAGSFCF